MRLSCMPEFRQTKTYVYLATFYSVTTGLTTYSIFHPILPFYLRHIFTDNCTNCSNDAQEVETLVSETIGIVSGTGSALQLVSCLCSGFLIHRFSLRINLFISLMLNILCPVFAFFATEVGLMCLANGAIAAGQTYSFVAYASIYNEYSTNQKELTRFHGFYRMANGFAFIIGYSVASVAYQFLGHKGTFGILFAALVLDIPVRAGLYTSKIQKITPPTLKPMLTSDNSVKSEKDFHDQDTERNQEVEKNGKAEDVDKTEDSGRLNLRELILNPYILLTSLVACLLYVTTSIFWASAPNFVVTTFGAEQWQIGLMMGVSSIIDLIVQLLVLIFIINHKRRCITLIVFHVLLAGGYAWYPFTTSIWMALIPETIVRCSRNSIVLQIATLYPYICECCQMGDKKVVYAICTVSVSVGMIIGNYITGVLIVNLTFRWLYIAMAALTAASTFSVIPFVTLRSNSQTLDATSIKVSIAELYRSDLGLSELTSSRLSISARGLRSKSDLSLNKSV